VFVTPRPYFDRLAPAYRTLERCTFGGLLHACRTAHLSRLRACRRALILGDGDGRFLADFVRSNPTVEVDSLDISPAMVALARRRLARIPGAAERVRFMVADARTDPIPSVGYDLVVTNFFLDCFGPAELATLVRRAVSACAPAVVWVDGDFRLPVSGWERWVARVLLAVMYGFFRLTTRLPARALADPAPLLAAEGFELVEEASWLRGFLSARLWVRGSAVPPPTQRANEHGMGCA
jgi:SAM-dependent methyltransferase